MYVLPLEFLKDAGQKAVSAARGDLMTSVVAVGRKLAAEQDEQPDGHALGASALRLEDLLTVANPGTNGVSLDLRYGEIVGISGLVGAGRTEILRGIFGIDPLKSGKIYRDGLEVRFKGPRDAIAAGIGAGATNTNL